MYYSEISIDLLTGIASEREISSTYRYICTGQNSVFKILMQTLQSCPLMHANIHWKIMTIKANEYNDTSKVSVPYMSAGNINYFMQHDYVQVGLARYQHK